MPRARKGPRPVLRPAPGAPAERLLVLRNRQHRCRIDLPLLRRIVRHLLDAEFRPPGFSLCFHLVAAPEITRLNESFLRHAGSTDVITFDHASLEAFSSSLDLRGEVFISLDDAAAQARRYRTSCPVELTRYVIHGLLHLRGHDDRTPAARRVMKREEDRLLKRVSALFPLPRLVRVQAVRSAG